MPQSKKPKTRVVEVEVFELEDAYAELMDILKVQIGVLKQYPNSPHTDENQKQVADTLALMREVLQIIAD